MSEQPLKTKEDWEIEKLREEVKELRSWVRRWVTSLGAVLGIITAGVSLVFAFKSEGDSKRALDLAEIKRQRNEFEADKAQRRLEEARILEMNATNRLTIASNELERLVQLNEHLNQQIGVSKIELAQRQTALESLSKDLQAITNFPATPEQRTAFENISTNVQVALNDTNNEASTIVNSYLTTETKVDGEANRIIGAFLPSTVISNISPSVEMGSFVQDVSFFGGWKRIHGDNDMDTDPGEKPEVKATTLLTNDSTRIWLEVEFYCSEYKGDNTTFRGIQKKVLFEAKNGKSIAAVHSVGDDRVSFSAAPIGRTHFWKPFSTKDVNASYWNRFGYVIDTPSSDDSKYVGVMGRISFAYELTESGK